MSTMTKHKYQLPDGQWIYHHNAYETDFVFNEIFVDRSYLKHGITISENAVVFDVGANIGLFSLLIKKEFPASKILAFEPSPEICQILRFNMARFADSVIIYNCGLADDEAEATFYFYPGYSVISGFHANQDRDAEIIITGMKSTRPPDNVNIESLVKARLAQLHTIPCQVTTIAKVIQQNQITEIDLLKLDVEGSELDVLKGISENDWPKIRQIVLEVHCKEDAAIVAALLNDKSFDVHVECDKRLKDSGVYNLFAIGKSRDC